MKTIERSHMPSKLWERIKLSNNYEKALEQIDERLIYWPKFLTHKCKQRLTRLTQVNIRMRRIAAEEARLGERVVAKLAPKIRDREEKRERKAEAAAKLERTIERELVERLRSGAYGDQPLNVSEAIWKKVLNAMEREGEGHRDKDHDKGIIAEGEEELDSEVESEEDLEKEVQFVDEDVESEDDMLEDLEDWMGSDDEDEDADEDEDEESEREQEVGKKRKRGKVIKMAKERTKQLRMDKEKERSKVAETLEW
jgi:protein MAK16